MDNGRYFALFYNVETGKRNVIYMEYTDEILKSLAAISPEKNEDGKYEVYVGVNEKVSQKCLVDSIDEGREAILDYYGEDADE